MAIVPFSQLVRRWVEQYAPFVWLALVAGLLAYASYRLATQTAPTGAAKDDDPANYPQAAADANAATVYFFHVDWCPFCVDAQPVWQRFVAAFDGRIVHGARVQCLSVNVTGTAEGAKVAKGSVNPALVQQYNLKQYPTVKIVCGGKVTLLDASTTDDALRSFLKDVTRAAQRASTGSGGA